MKTLFNDEKLAEVCGERVPKDAPLPKFGICVFVEAKHAKAELFTLITYQNIDYLLRKEDSKISEIAKVKTKKEKEKFRKAHLIF